MFVYVYVVARMVFNILSSKMEGVKTLVPLEVYPGGSMWWVASPLRGPMSHLTQRGAFEQFPITRQDLSGHPSIQLTLN